MCAIYQIDNRLIFNNLGFFSTFQYNVIAGLSNTDVQDGLKTNIFIMAPATSLPSGCG